MSHHDPVAQAFADLLERTSTHVDPVERFDDLVRAERRHGGPSRWLRPIGAVAALAAIVFALVAVLGENRNDVDVFDQPTTTAPTTPTTTIGAGPTTTVATSTPPGPAPRPPIDDVIAATGVIETSAGTIDPPGDFFVTAVEGDLAGGLVFETIPPGGRAITWWPADGDPQILVGSDVAPPFLLDVGIIDDRRVVLWTAGEQTVDGPPNQRVFVHDLDSGVTTDLGGLGDAEWTIGSAAITTDWIIAAGGGDDTCTGIQFFDLTGASVNVPGNPADPTSGALRCVAAGSIITGVAAAPDGSSFVYLERIFDGESEMAPQIVHVDAAGAEIGRVGLGPGVRGPATRIDFDGTWVVVSGPDIDPQLVLMSNGFAEPWTVASTGADARFFDGDVLVDPTSQADPSHVGYHRVVGVRDDDVLNVRSDAGITSAVIGRFLPGQADVYATGPTKTVDGDAIWYEVRFAASTGWVNATFLEPLTGSGPGLERSDVAYETDRATVTISRVWMTGLEDPATATAINDAVTAQIDALVRQWAELEVVGDQKSSVALRANETHFTDDVISLHILYSAFASGAANDFSGAESLTFDLTSGDQFELGDVLVLDGRAEALWSDRLVEVEWDGNREEFSSYVGGATLAAAAWNTTESGLLLMWDEYVAGPGVIGTTSVEIGWDEFPEGVVRSGPWRP